jgi:K+-transporting ATPase KdpF subunit
MKGGLPQGMTPFVLSDSNKNNRSHDHDGYHSAWHRDPILRAVLCLHTSLRQALTGETTMTLDYILSGAVTVFLTVYLTYALLRPERF